MVTDKAIKIKEVEGRLSLYSRFYMQSKPQDCYIVLDLRDGAMTAESNPETGSMVSEHIYYGRVKRYSIPIMYAESVNDLMQEIKPFAQRVVNGAEIDYELNKVFLDADAQDANAQIINMTDYMRVDEDAKVKYWDSCDWMTESDKLEVAEALGITADMTEKEVEALEAKALEEYLNPGECDIIEDMAGYLCDVLDAVREKAEELQ